MSTLSIEQYLIDHPELTRGDATKTMNRLIDLEWHFRYNESPEDQIDKTINFGEYFGQLSPEREIWLKQCLNPTLVEIPFTAQESGLIVGSKNSIKDCLTTYKKVVVHLNEMSLTKLSELNRQQIDMLLEKAIATNLHFGVSEALPSFTTAKRMHFELSRISQSFELGTIIDGFKTFPTREEMLDRIRTVIGPKFLGEEFDFAKWSKGTKFDGLPVTQSIALLMGCINFFETHKVRQVVALSKLESAGFLSRAARLKLLKNGLVLDLQKSEYYRHKQCRDEIEATFAEAYGVNSFDQIPEEAHNRIEWEHDDWKSIRGGIPVLAGLTVALLCGARRNELESMNWGDVFQDDQGNWKFKSDINKTNQGLSTVRYIAGKAAEVLSIWKELAKAINPELTGPMFGWSTSAKSAETATNRMSSGNANQAIQARINRFINPSLAPDLQVHDFNIHSVRHAWAEFAMRRFDGAIVPELVRMHFRHHWGSYMKDRYLMGKQFEDDGVAVSQRYAAELIGRHINADLNLYGPVADFIGKRIEEMKFVNQGDLSEEDIDLIADEFQSQLEPHEYGYCLTRPATITQAKCYNKDTGLAETDKAQWDKCGSCPNRLTLPEHVYDLRRLGMSLKGTYDYWKGRGIDKAADRWAGLLKMTQQQIKAIEEGNPELIPLVCETESKETEHV